MTTAKKARWKMNKFEVGKFYAVQVSNWSKKKISALCIRTTKCTVTFQYLIRYSDDRIEKVLCRRRKKIDGELECAYDHGEWSMITSTYSTEVRDKPKIWDEVKEVKK